MRPLEAYFGSDIVCVLGNEEQVRQVVPDQELIRQMDGVCFHITAHGNEGDGLEIAPEEAHQTCSQSDDAVEFLVISMPKAHEDRIPVKTRVIR